LSDSVAAGWAAICSDHTPVGADDKLLPFGEAKPGATGLEVLLPLTLKWAEAAQVDLPTALARITAMPARILGSSAGCLAIGTNADICVFDPEATWQLTPEALKSRGKNSLAGLHDERPGQGDAGRRTRGLSDAPIIHME
jgi:dihydroorotase